eukprot:8267081-Lingulodinium_polyedra.AAC.1
MPNTRLHLPAVATARRPHAEPELRPLANVTRADKRPHALRTTATRRAENGKHQQREWCHLLARAAGNDERNLLRGTAAANDCATQTRAPNR